MDVTVNVGSQSTRSDFMISDAAIPQRVEENNNQAEKFEEMLAKADDKLKKFSDVKKAFDEGKYDVPTVEELKKSGTINSHSQFANSISDNPRELAKQIFNGEISIDQVPLDMITPKLLRELASLWQTGNGLLDESEEPKLIKSLKELCEMLKSGELDEKLIPEELRGLDFTEEIAMLVKKRVENNDDEETDETVNQNVMASLMNVDVSDDISDELVQLLEAFQSKEADESDVFGKVEFAEISNLGENLSEKQAESDVLTENIGKIVDNQVENAADGKTAEFSLEISEEAAIIENAAKNGEISKAEVKTVKAEKPETPEQEEKLFENGENVSVKAVDERSKALSEELEMLKNAKQKPETEPKMQTQGKTNEIQLTQNIAESQVVFRKDNGETLVVSQKEVVSQVQKLVEQIISENREQNEYSLVLNPEELGKITVKMTKASDGAVSVTIVAENARTQRILEQNSELMQSNLRNNGVNLESWQTVSQSRQNPNAQDYQGSAKNPYSAQENNSDEEQEEDGKSFADLIAAM